MSRNRESKKVRIDETYFPERSTGKLPRSTRPKPGYLEPLDICTINLRSIVKPRTSGQLSFFKNIRSDVPISICLGPAGSGKTFLTCAAALIALKEQKVERIIVTRPAVESEESIGFLPGTIEDKMLPYMIPIIDCFTDLVGGKTTDLLFKKGTVQVRPFAFMRGSTFSKSFIIADEMQNSSVGQFKCLLTRIGESSKLVVSGDPEQSDIDGPNGLSDFSRKFTAFYKENRIAPRSFSFDIMSDLDIVRHRAVKDVLDIYSFQSGMLRSAA